MAELVTIQRASTKSAIVFIHGFSGNVDRTWAKFPSFLRDNSALESWNIFGFGYPTSLLPGTPGIWSADPDLPKLALSFFTELDIPPLSECDDIAIVAHSMGGLVVERALADNSNQTQRIKHLFLFGTPSAGVNKANIMARLFGMFVGGQVLNMQANGDFITELRSDWDRVIGAAPRFQFLTIAGDKDNFVPAESALNPFPRKFRRVVAGDHLGMVKPRNAQADVVRLLVSALTQSEEPVGPSSPLRLAAETGGASPEGMTIALEASRGQRHLASQEEVVEAALALDSNGQRADAMNLLERYQHLGTDVSGTLAGRIKRRWVQNGDEADALWAFGLYKTALLTAQSAVETQHTIGQIFYHAINLSYLNQVAFNKPAEAKEMAALGLKYARRKHPADVWSIATEAEAWLYLGDYQEALSKYREMVALTPEKWKLASTGQQAHQIAAKLNRADLQQQLSNIFDPPPASSLAAKTP